jgi:FKBP-type peptidyl-prolyl cis-trans isomerase
VIYFFVFSVAKVIEAWELAIPTMQVGELAEIICTSDYGTAKIKRAYCLNLVFFL